MSKLPIEKFTPENLQVSNNDDINHVFEQSDCDALWAAYAAGRPLLLRGAPGTGKSQMARAIAHQLGWVFVKESINGSTELSDLHWHFDAISRLGEAQIQGLADEKQAKLEALSPLNFLSPGGFWWAYSWLTAADIYNNCKTRLRAKPKPPDTWDEEKGGVVLLIDEIDKAQPDLPNGLLETLGDLSFTVPYLSSEAGKSQLSYASSVIVADKDRPMLIIFTTNEERDLPQAFLRRCFVHTLKMEEAGEEVHLAGEGSPKVAKRIAWLVKRGKMHFKHKICDAAYLEAAKLLWKDRKLGGVYKPGLAEYIDLLRAIKGEAEEKQLELLDKIACYAIKKEVG